jgi:hypothetical protein
MKEEIVHFLEEEACATNNHVNSQKPKLEHGAQSPKK